jgi:Rha family phage regulatory protein
MAKSPARRTAPRIAVVNGLPTTTSRDIAETFGKRHDDVLKRIRALDCSAEFRLRNFAETVSERANPSGGAPIPSTEYRITRDGFAFLCMGFTGARAAAWKEKYINTFNRLAEEARKPKPAVLLSHAPSIDVSALLLQGQSDPVALTHAQQAAINRHAWMLSHEAYELIRQHIERRVAYTTTPVRRQIPGHVEAVVRSVTLGNALAHLYHAEAASVLDVMNMLKVFADKGAAKVQEALAALNNPATSLKTISPKDSK